MLGDGVNWGVRAALASRAAVQGAMDYLNQALFGVARYCILLNCTYMPSGVARCWNCNHRLILTLEILPEKYLLKRNEKKNH